MLVRAVDGDALGSLLLSDARRFFFLSVAPVAALSLVATVAPSGGGAASGWAAGHEGPSRLGECRATRGWGEVGGPSREVILLMCSRPHARSHGHTATRTTLSLVSTLLTWAAMMDSASAAAPSSEPSGAGASGAAVCVAMSANRGAVAGVLECLGKSSVKRALLSTATR